MYLGFVLSEDSRKSILGHLFQVGLLGEDYITDNDILCHHVTLYYNPTFDVMQDLVDRYRKPINVIAHDVFSNGDACCISCSIDGEHMSLDNREFHVTIWVGEHYKSSYSNLLMEEEGPCGDLGKSGITLTGEVKLIP